MPAMPLPPRALAWTERQLHAEVLSSQRLPGSTSATLHRLQLASGPPAVLRLFDRLPDWLLREPDLARHEAASLERAAGQRRVPTPHLLALDERGEACGVPSLLMSWLPGTVQLNPPDPAAWLDGLAATLARLHRIPPGGFGWPYFPYQDAGRLSPPPWSGVPHAWAEAGARVRSGPPTYPLRFIHRDYHPANVLWQGSQVSGVVDWVNACVGPAGADVGHCMVNLAQMYGVAAADAFRAGYERHSGECVPVYWALRSLLDMLDGPPQVYPGWPAFGLTGLSDGLIRARLDAYLVSLLEL